MLRLIRWGLFLVIAALTLMLVVNNSKGEEALPPNPRADPAYAEIEAQPLGWLTARNNPSTELERQYSEEVRYYESKAAEIQQAEYARSDRSNTLQGVLAVFAIAFAVALLPWTKWFSSARRSAEIMTDHAVSLAAKGSEAWKDATAPSPVIGRHGLKSYSVADELLKWSKLRDEGVVTEAEYEEARVKLLAR